MRPTAHNRALALAGVFQVAELVRQIAWDGTVDSHDFEVTVKSLFTIDAPTPEAIYGGVENLRTGLKKLSQMASPARDKATMDVMRYVIGVLHLERRLAKNGAMGQRIHEGIQQAENQLSFFEATHENMIARLADLYHDTISQLGPRIIVQGDQRHLSNPGNAARIRTLLLAGIRAAVLWRQAGGNRWRILFGRKSLVQESQKMLAQLGEPA
ncbi:MAG: high frequency lysogenization protein HflD [Gammaproteobacteria bacterium]|jgi:high frequency lysogenization protein